MGVPKILLWCGVSEISEGSRTDGPSNCLVSPGALTATADELMMLGGRRNRVFEQERRGGEGEGTSVTAEMLSLVKCLVTELERKARDRRSESRDAPIIVWKKKCKNR